ncbi:MULTISPECIES: hypothetical protein [Agrobacterium]|uniref:Uncharacterized protein n=1 Tax=Agrobacterium pusense TaxID=648995 RepID=A0A6H0ZW57_9HYPH|nr:MULTISPECIES: hypothetical protein [Agrobacterium]ANV26335.1 hypothetical protein BA939_20570 [Rhizobium sp. S41]KGE83246.1 hypothetical protein LW14_08880 [Rhizobium sp. H41]MDH0874010.1 hypothetical protein [Agrobacterium pusense]MDH2089113.1 hypothetical protein [Agrobacterium pusense]QIX24347.1 hypothetical protein FOB41_24990 [Agrobacterium pusense]
MLPPVSKVSAADATYGASLASAQRAQPKSVVQPQPSAAFPEQSASLFSRAAVASLAGEFQLARSTAVLAETLGKLMNLPRRDGEAVETYVGRLTEALRALPPAQRLALEQQIGKALQGLSLSMLAEILKQPTGPDAARLALLIELSRYRGADLAARAVVSSYQQNNSASPAPAQPRQQPTAASPNAEFRSNPPAAAQLPGSTTTGRLLPLLTGPLALSGAAMKATVTALTAQPEGAVRHSAAPANAPDLPDQSAKPEGRTETTTRPLPPQTGSMTKEALAETRPGNSPRAQTGETRPALPPREMMKTEQKDVRTASPPIFGPPATDAENVASLVLAATAGKLPARASTTQQPPAMPQGIEPPSPEDQPTEKSGLMTSAAHPTGEEAETVAHRPEAPYSSRLPLDPEARMAMMEQSASQSLVAAALAKDGTPLPLVAYPPADDDYESEAPPRGGGPFSDDEAESESGAESENSGDDDGLEERVAANDGIDTQERPTATAADDSAENYYLKMSGVL